jgi:TRAP-type C4-dicarboxylate transport system permease small subunit
VLERRHPVYVWIVNLERLIPCVLLVGVFVLVLTQVFTRYVLGTPLSWTEEAARLALVWLTFMAAAFVSSRRAHITVDLIVTIVPRRVAAAIGVLAQVLVIATAAFLGFAGIGMVLLVDGITLPATGLPTAALYAAALVGFILILIHSVLALYMQLRYPDEEPDPRAKAAELEGL